MSKLFDTYRNMLTTAMVISTLTGCGDEANNEKEDGTNTDPRWNDLKKILNK